MINIEYVKYQPTSIDDIKDKKLKENLKSIPTLIDEIKDKRISEFEESVRKFSIFSILKELNNIKKKK